MNHKEEKEDRDVRGRVNMLAIKSDLQELRDNLIESDVYNCQPEVYNYQDNKQPNPDVNWEKGSDQKAKGVNIKTRKQPGEDAKRMNIMKGKFLLKPLFLLLLTISPVTSVAPSDLKWLQTDKTVKGTYETDITLVWKYESSSRIDIIDISRGKTEYEKENVALWTPEKGSVASRLITTDVTLEHRKVGAVGTIILTLLTAYPVDFDKMYSCVISSEHGLHSMDKELEAYNFKWLPTNKTVKGLYETDITLVWKYESSSVVDKIDISRSKTEYEKENVVLWTSEKGSKPSPFLTTYVNLEHRKEGDVGTIILTLLTAYPEDFDKIYSCVISSEHGLHSMDKELEAYKLEYWPLHDVVKSRPGQDVTLVWIYKYPLPAKYVSFYLDNDIQDEVLEWSSFAGIYNIEDRYKNRVKFNMTSNNDQVEITLTLLKTTRDDYNHTYHSRAIVPKGYWDAKEIYLRPSPEEKPVSSRQQPSSASGLSRVSLFLVCFVSLLAVQI